MIAKTFAGRRLSLAAIGLLLTGVLAPAVARGPSHVMLGSLDKGQWEVRYRDGAKTGLVCLRSGQELIQLRHGAREGCSHFVVEEGPKAITVQYTCKGNGYGRTSVRRESASLVQIDSQGIAGGMPFDFRAEARNVGSCR